MVRELTVTPAGPQPVTIDYRIDNRRGKRVGANQHTEPVAAAQAGR
ncbi:glycosyl hydrolase family 2 [Klebsiella pneumoniae]|nr:glycosyl hydrolase family 2 [Klebsiella pneumoniae]